jgi:hypothetical protein
VRYHFGSLNLVCRPLGYVAIDPAGLARFWWPELAVVQHLDLGCPG